MGSEVQSDHSILAPPSAPSTPAGQQGRFGIALALLVLAFFLGGGLLAPWVYALAKQAAGWLGMTAAPFPRYVPRSMPLAAFLCLWPLMRFVGFRSLRDMGLVGPVGQHQKFLFALFAGMLALLMVSGIGLVGGANRLNEDIRLSAVLSQLAVLVPGAIAVALTEEILFRGVLLTLLCRLWSWPVALVASSAAFAVLHFMHRPDFSGPITWYSGVSLLPSILSGIADVRGMGAFGISLFLAGMLFGIAYGRTGNLYFPVGLHAGAILAIKLHLALTTEIPQTDTWLWGSRDLIDGWVAIAVLAVAVTLFAIQGAPLAAPARATTGGLLVRRLASSSIQATFVGYIGLLGIIVLVSAGVSHWLTGLPDPPDGRPNAERLARHSVRDHRELHRAAEAAGLITARRLIGVIDVAARLDDQRVAIIGWLADKEGRETPLDVVVFVRGARVARGQTNGERPDVTDALRLARGAEKHTSFRVVFECRTGDQPIVVGLSAPKYYVPLKSPPCP